VIAQSESVKKLQVSTSTKLFKMLQHISKSDFVRRTWRLSSPSIFTRSLRW